MVLEKVDSEYETRKCLVVGEIHPELIQLNEVINKKIKKYSRIICSEAYYQSSLLWYAITNNIIK